MGGFWLECIDLKTLNKVLNCRSEPCTAGIWRWWSWCWWELWEKSSWNRTGWSQVWTRLSELSPCLKIWFQSQRKGWCTHYSRKKLMIIWVLLGFPYFPPEKSFCWSADYFILCFFECVQTHYNCGKFIWEVFCPRRRIFSPPDLRLRLSLRAFVSGVKVLPRYFIHIAETFATA